MQELHKTAIQYTFIKLLFFEDTLKNYVMFAQNVTIAQ